MGTLVIGLGNPYRGDDAAGLLTVRKVRRGRRVERHDCNDLIDLIDGEDDVVIVDAVRSGGEPGSVHRFEASADRLPLRSSVSSHNLGLAETIELARLVRRMPESLTVFGIEAVSVEAGDTVTPAVEAATDRVAAEIEQLLS